MSIDQMAEHDFSRAVRRAYWRKVSTWLTGESNELLPFDEVRDRLPLQGQSYRGLQVVPLEKIVGSLGRYRDFDRCFLPRTTRTKDRWVSIDLAHYDQIPLPPVELYKIGEVYFVKDGNHRVSVAAQRGQEAIDAFVTEIRVPVPLTEDTEIEDLILKQEYARFLEQTQIEAIRPGVRIELTLPGEYDRLLEHINTHRWYLGERRGEEVSYREAVASWYDNVYAPLVRVIQEQNLLAEFPGRTEADLYLWIIEYQWYRRVAYREHFSIEEAAQDFISNSAQWPVKKLVNVLRDAAWIDNLILEQERRAFFEQTRLDEIVPDARIELTLPGQYDKILEHIHTHRWHLGEARGGPVPHEEAVESWYRNVHLPLVTIIREHKILDEFPGRTEADLYLWTMEHRAELSAHLGWEVDPIAAASDLAEHHRPRSERVSGRVGDKIVESMVPAELSAGPGPGLWRRERLRYRPDGQLFREILVAINGEDSGWDALDQALEVAGREEGRLHGVHIVPAEEQTDGEASRALQAMFAERCNRARLPGELVVEAGAVSRKICELARWTDLVVIPLNYPPSPQPIAKLGSGLRQLVRQCSRPILAVPRAPTALKNPLLAYDGSRTADEALFTAATLVHRWKISLHVLSVREAGISARTLRNARRYLRRHRVSATYINKSGPVGEGILQTARERACDWILVGGYGRHPVLELVLGSAIDQVLRESPIPVLICK